MIVLVITTINLQAIYSFNRSDIVAGYSLPQIVWYFAGISLIWFCIWNPVDSNISRKVLSGDLSVDLLRPVSVFHIEFASALSSRMIAIVLELVPCTIIFCAIVFPEFLTFVAVVKFVVLTVGAFVLYFIINYIIGLSAFYIKSNYSLQTLRIILIVVTSGALMPFEFYPSIVRKLISFLPFPYIFYWPIKMLVNEKSDGGAAAFFSIWGMQILWIALLYIASRLIWYRAVRTYCATGG